MNAKEFIKKHKPLSDRSSILFKYRADLFKLRKSGYTLDQIKLFLKENDIEILIQSISWYFLKHPEPASENKLPNSKPSKPALIIKEPDPVKISAPPNISRKVNSPEELRKLMYAPVDIKAILKAAKDIEDAEKAAKLLNK